MKEEGNGDKEININSKLRNKLVNKINSNSKKIK